MANEVVKKIQDEFLVKIGSSTKLDDVIKEGISSLFENPEGKITKKEICEVLETLMQEKEVQNENSKSDS